MVGSLLIEIPFANSSARRFPKTENIIPQYQAIPQNKIKALDICFVKANFNHQRICQFKSNMFQGKIMLNNVFIDY